MNQETPKQVDTDGVASSSDQSVSATAPETPLTPSVTVSVARTVESKHWVSAAIILAFAVVIGFGIYFYTELYPSRGDSYQTDESFVSDDPADWNLPPKTEPENDPERWNDVIEPDKPFIETADYSSLYKNVAKQPGVVWFQYPMYLPDVQYAQVNSDNVYGAVEFRFYQIGTFYGEPIIFADFQQAGMGVAYDHAVYYGSPDTVVRRLAKHTSEDYPRFVTEDSQVLVDETLTFSALDFQPVREGGLEPSNMQYHNVGNIQSLYANSSFNPDYRSYLSSDDEVNNQRRYDLVEDTPFGPLYRYRYIDDENQTMMVKYVIRSVGGLLVPYDYRPLPYLTDDRVLQITWKDGTTASSVYRMDGLSSCGGGGPELAYERVAAVDMTEAGVTSNGTPVFTVTNPNHHLIERVFEITQGKVYTYDKVTRNTTERVITRDEFIAARGVIIIENDFGEQMIFTHGDYGPQAECGKPVIYLYPTATTTVSVKVDALITKSDPLYNDGWTVTAYPDGRLVHKGSPYESLFWDGYGNGAYPVLDKGFVVETDRALALMGDHLLQMGFNEKEISDFKLFWKDYLPTTPYTQFSWIGTADMNTLAPLSITPRPDTILRAFVDFKGLEEPIAITPQKIYKIERNGFTATEWGGIIRK